MRNGNRLSILLMAFGLILSGCGKAEQKDTAVPALLEPIAVAENTIEVERQDFYSAVYINVSVVPQTEELSFAMDGQILEVCVNEGQLVKKGDVLAKIDQTALTDAIKTLQTDISYEESIYEMRLTQADLDIQIAEAKMEKLQSEYEEQEQRKAEEEAQKKAEEEAQKKEYDDILNQESSKIEESSIVIGDEEESSNISGDESNTEESSVLLPEDSEPVEEPEQSEDSQPIEDSKQPEDSQPTEDSKQPEDSQPAEDSEKPEIPQTPEEGIQPQITITKYDLQRAVLAIQEAELAYTQLQEQYDHTTTQRQAELQALLDKVGEDTISASFDGRVVKIFNSVGDYVREYDVVMLLANEEVKLLRGDKYSNSSLSSALNLDVIIDGVTYEATYIPYSEEEYIKRSMNKESLPSWFEVEQSEDITFGESGTVRMYKDYSEDTLVIPVSCVYEDELGSYVYKSENGQRIKTYVTIGIETPSFAEILDGLNEGDEVYGAE